MPILEPDMVTQNGNPAIGAASPTTDFDQGLQVARGYLGGVVAHRVMVWAAEKKIGAPACGDGLVLREAGRRRAR